MSRLKKAPLKKKNRFDIRFKKIRIAALRMKVFSSLVSYDTIAKDNQTAALLLPLTSWMLALGYMQDVKELGTAATD